MDNATRDIICNVMFSINKSIEKKTNWSSHYNLRESTFRSELQNLANRRMNSLSDNESGDSSGEHHRRLMGDLRGHIKDLEEKRARGLPIISLVDNMVKLGSLYRGPEDAPLSHRVRNIPVEQIQQRSTMTSHDLHQQHQQQLHQQQQLHVSTKRKADIQVHKKAWL